MGLELLGDYLAHVHVKNAHWRSESRGERNTLRWVAESVSLNDGIVNWIEVLTDIRTVGYDGYLSFEDFSSEKPTDEKLSCNLNYMRQLLEELG